MSNASAHDNAGAAHRVSRPLTRITPNTMTTIRTLYIRDISGTGDGAYAVPYRTSSDRISDEQRARAIGKARRIATRRSGNRRAMQVTLECTSPRIEWGETVHVPMRMRPLDVCRGEPRQPLAVFEFGSEFDWHNLQDAIQARMVGRRFWRIDTATIDWRGRSGSKFVEAATALDILRPFYTEDSVRLYRGRQFGQFELDVSTHDTPLCSRYMFTAVTESTYDRHS
jgi:hypothetical protein